MSFVTKEWKDRLAEFAGRRKLTNVSTGEETTVDVSRAEGEVSQAGDAFSAANMNDLEQRIKDGFDKVDTNLGGNNLVYQDGNFYIENRGADTGLKKLGSKVFDSEMLVCAYNANANIDYTVADDGDYAVFILPHFNTGSAYVKMGDNIYLNQSNITNANASKYIKLYSCELIKGQTVKVQVIDTLQNTYASVAALFKIV